MRKTTLIGAALGLWLIILAAGGAATGATTGSQIFKGPMDPSGKIRFELRESKQGKAPRLDRFRLRFDCRDGLGQAGQTYGAAAGDAIRPDGRGRFRIREVYTDLTFELNGDFNRRYTEASGSFRFVGDVGDGAHPDCDTGKLSWQTVPVA